MKKMSRKEFEEFVHWLAANGYKKMPKGLDAWAAYALFKYDAKSMTH